MRRFLDWTAGQPAPSQNSPSQQQQSNFEQTQTTHHSINNQQQQSSINFRRNSHQGQLIGSSSSSSSNPINQQYIRQQQQSATNPTRDLETQHLIKLLHEIKYYQASSSPLPTAFGLASSSQAEFVEKVHKTLPLFLKVFNPNQVPPHLLSSSSITSTSPPAFVDNLGQEGSSSSSISNKTTGLVKNAGSLEVADHQQILINSQQQQSVPRDNTFVSESSLLSLSSPKSCSPLPPPPLTAGPTITSAPGQQHLTNMMHQSSSSSYHHRSQSSTTTTSSTASNVPLQHMERFPEILPFSYTVARLFVSEVRQRASNKHVQDASLAILQYLNPAKSQHHVHHQQHQQPVPTLVGSSTASQPMQSTPNANTDAIQQQSTIEQQLSSSSTGSISTNSNNNQETAQGWNLLLSLNTLALSQSPQIIQLLCDASLPSTLIKCLYLFFDLPEPKSTTSSPSVPQTANDNISGAGNSDNKSTDANVNQPSSLSSTTSAGGREVSVNSGPLIKAFTQLLVQVCSYQASIDELIKKDDLRLLIGIASSQCSKWNRAWRRTAFQAMLTISKNMRDNFYYLETHLCIPNYVEHMHRLNSLGLVGIDEHIDMIKILLEFVYNLDTNNRNQPRQIEPLIEQFKSSRISELIEEAIIKLDESIIFESTSSQNMQARIASNHQQQQQNILNKAKSSSELPTIDRQSNQYQSINQQQQHSSTSDLNNQNQQQQQLIHQRTVLIEEYRRYVRRLILSLTIMAKINICQDSMINIVNLKPLTTSRFEMFEQFRMPKPSAKNCILNYEILRLFKLIWSKCQDNSIIESVLDATISLFNDDKYNYFIFESQQLIVYYMTSYNFSSFPLKIKQKLFKFLEFIIIETNYIPCLELGTLGTIITKKSILNSDLILGLRTLIACLKFNSKFSDIFKEIGLLEVIIELLIKFMQKNESLSLSTSSLLINDTTSNKGGSKQDVGLVGSNNDVAAYGTTNSLTDLRISSENLEILSLLLEASQYLLIGPNNANCQLFNESGAARHVFNCISKPDFFHSYVQIRASSSEDYNNYYYHSATSGTIGVLPQSRNNTPPLSASHLRTSTTSSHVSFSQQYLDQIVHNKPSIKQLQKYAFTIIRQLILSTTGDEHLANLLGLLARNLDDLKRLKQQQSIPASPMPDGDVNETGSEDPEIKSKELRINFAVMVAQEVNLKICILKSLMIILKESHRCRSLFRKAGGFIYIISSLVTLEKALSSYSNPADLNLDDSDSVCLDPMNSQSDKHYSSWKRVNSRRVWRLIKNCLMTIVVAIRSEPANSRTFFEEVLADFTEAIRRLGCFRDEQKVLLESQQRPELTNDVCDELINDNFHLYKSIFLHPLARDLSTIPNDNIKANEASCQIFRFLFDMSIDMADGTHELDAHLGLYQQKMSSLRDLTTSRHQSNVDIKSMSFDQSNCNRNSPSPSSGSHSLITTSATTNHHHHHSHNQRYNSQRESNVFQKRSQLNMAPKRPPSLDLENHNKNAFENNTNYLTFPSVILSILDLIPSSPNEDLMIFMSQILKSLFKHERNIQMLCEAGMISKLLSNSWKSSLLNRKHILNETSEYMLEKLTRQLITPKELRMFFRLNEPMECLNLDEIEINESSDETKRKLEKTISERKANQQRQTSASSTNLSEDGTINNQSLDRSSSMNSSSDIQDQLTTIIPMVESKRIKKEKILTERIATLVEMMQLEDRKNHLQPPYVEFNMSRDGFSSIFMPSIAPINVKSLPQQQSSFLNSTLDVHTSEKNGILGGVGTIERVFPPISGLTFSSWFCIQKFPARSSDASHNIRLLTIYRGSASTGKEYSCFRIQISALDRALTISTQEVLLFDNDSQHNDPDCNLRIWTPELLVEGKWHHLVVTINRSALKQSRIHVYIDGMLVHHQRINYISNFVGSINSGPLGNVSSQSNSSSAAAFVNSFIGSLPQYRLQLKTQWKQGPCHLIEESLNSNFVAIIHALGPNFIGNFQSSAKLYELARNNILQSVHNQSQFSKNYMSTCNNNSSMTSMTDSPSGGHRPLTHQQSAATVHTSQQHQLIRVASSQIPGSQSPVNQLTTSHANSSSGGGNLAAAYHILEERILMSIDARAASLMSLQRMRRIYTRFDCRQVSRVLGLAMQDNSNLPILLLHNTGVHLNGPSRGVGAITIGLNHVRCFTPSPTQQTIISLGGCYILLGLIAQAETVESFTISLQALVTSLEHSTILEAQMENINGYQILSVFFWKKKHLLNPDILKCTFSLITNSASPNQSNCLLDDGGRPVIKCIHQVGALRDLICECFDLWLQTDMLIMVLEFIYDLISSNPSTNLRNQNTESHQMINSSRVKNLKCLRDMDLLPRMLRLLPQYDSQQVACAGILESSSSDMSKLLEQTSKTFDNRESPSFDAKAVYLIKQTVFELLNRTPRQTDLLYFGQFLASLLPSKNKERPARTVSLRNILLKSLLQMMTKNKQHEINQAMQEELVKILGFDWFMLFISGSHLDFETITVGCLNLMIVLSNDELYASFKQTSNTKTSLRSVATTTTTTTNPGTQQQQAGGNGSWLKEPIFPTIDGKFNIQLLGINVGVFFGLSGRRKSIKHEVLESPNFFLLTNNLTNLIHFPRIYLMIFQTMMSTFSSKLESGAIDTIEMFDKLTMDILCDSLVGDTHHKRRQTLSGVRFKCHELVVCLIYMIGHIMFKYDVENEIEDGVDEEDKKRISQYPVDIVRFLMYLYNNNQEFQQYCKRSDELIDALCESLQLDPLNSSESHAGKRRMTQHPASKEILELSRLIVLDTMTDCQLNGTGEESSYNNHDQSLHAFERFLESLSNCKEAQGSLVDMLLRQILLMIDSTARHNSIKTIGSLDNVLQFQLLLTNSILISQIVTDKISSKDLYPDELSQCLSVLDHQLCLVEQTFKFNEILPKNNPPYAFIIQRVLNRTILFALSRPMQHISDKMILLDLLKRIYDNRTIIILNHMHSQHSAEFFVCMTYCLLRIIEDNSEPTNSIDLLQQQSLIEKQYQQNLTRNSPPPLPPPNSSALMLVSMAKKVWDAIYQSKKGVLSEAFDVSLSLPAFTLETSLNLVQLKPDIIECCERYWVSFIESELKQTSSCRQRRSLLSNQKQPADSSGSTATSSAVNLLSGRLTKVVNAASFVSRVVGATAGTMASNVNLVGERITQSASRTNSSNLSRKDSTSMIGSNPSGPNRLLSQPTQQEQVDTSCLAPDQSDLFKNPGGLSKEQIEEAAQTHISIIEDYIEGQLSQKNHKLVLHKYLCDEWLDTEYEVLLRERALFGPDYGSKLDKWCLDMTEGPRRMRKKMVNNTRQFYDNYPYTPSQYNPSNKSLRYRPPMSYDSHLYYLKTLGISKHLLELTDSNTSSATQRSANLDYPSDQTNTSTTHVLGVEETKLPNFHHSSIESLTAASNKLNLSATAASSPSPKPSDCGAGGDQDDGDSTSFVDFSPEIEAETNSARESAENIDSLSVLRLLEKNERISHMFRCSRVQGLDTYEGLLLFGREHFYLIDGFTLLKTREIKDIDSLAPDAHDPIIPNSTPNILAAGQNSKKICAKFAFDSVVEVHKRRYLLQPIALEVFSSDGRNTLIVFPRNIRNKVYSRLMTVSTQLTNNASESLAGQKSNVSVEGGSGLLSNLIGDTSVTQRWVRGELSNFQYLMNLNTIAGRSYNDLMQYPIFPWILADYSSDKLDFSKPSTFRNLSRPVGAQTGERLEQFKRRFADWDDTETPPYHYGTFYSSAMIVASYMVRMEPFTQHFLRLQGGHFDLADRMFHSVQDSWLSASKHNMADIKELIPEFFYLPEFLTNSNKYDLGIKQNGLKLNDVILPPWAKGETREFIRLHRCALESDYVSAHLHEWIDLIFGYKQQGQPAVEAVNVFHHLFYEGNVDIYNTDIDPIKKNAVIGFINNFGQVPKQLFKKPHPARKVTSTSFLANTSQASIPLTPILPSLSSTVSGSSSLHKVLTHNPQSLKQTNACLKELRGPVGQIVQMDTKNVVAVEQNKLLIPPEYCRYIAWGHADRSLRLGLYDSEKPIFVWEGSEHMAPNEILSCTIPNNRIMITAGTESVITVWKIEKMKSFTPQLNLYGHVEPVTCLASSQSYSIIVSGSRDRTAIIWDLNRFTFVRQLGGGPENKLVHHGPISAIAINDSSGDIATCASSWLYLWTINGELLAQIDSLSVAIQQISLGAGIGGMMHQNTSISGNLPGQLHILSVCFSQYNEWDLDEVIMTGASDGSVAVWSMRYYQAPLKFNQIIDDKENQKEVESSVVVSQESKQPEPEVEAVHEESQQSTLNHEKSPEETVDNESGAGLMKNSDDVIATLDQPTAASASDPIVIRGRKRTDTMNSDWVKLSTSSNSTSGAETIAALRATPSSLNDNNPVDIHDMLASSIEGVAESYTRATGGFFPQDQEQSTPNYSITVTNINSSTEVEGCGENEKANNNNNNNILTESSHDRQQQQQQPRQPQVSAKQAHNLLLSPTDPSLIKFSKSDTSLIDSFVILGESGAKQSSLVSNPNCQLSGGSSAAGEGSCERARPQSSMGETQISSTHSKLAQATSNTRKQRLISSHEQQARVAAKRNSKLLPGHCWQRELFLRAILPRRTAAANSKGYPPAVTSITISKDHKTVFLGDASGRVSSWSTS